MFWDARVPVVFCPAEDAGPDDMLLTMDGAVPTAAAAPPGHAAGCNCCVPRTGAAKALAALFTDRARKRIPWFTRVVVAADAAGVAEIRAALRDDPLASAWFRLG